MQPSEKMSEDIELPKKRTHKILSKKERERLLNHLNGVDPLVLTGVTKSKLHKQCHRFLECLTRLIDTLYAHYHEKLVKDILLHHCACFG